MRIRWSELAVHDFTQICDYIDAHSSSDIARRVALRIYESIGTLFRFPESGRSGRKPETRELVFTGLPYVAIYRIAKNSVEILRILHGAQQWP
jgi:toxin ParE1/3/4